MVHSFVILLYALYSCGVVYGLSSFTTLQLLLFDFNLILFFLSPLPPLSPSLPFPPLPPLSPSPPSLSLSSSPPLPSHLNSLLHRPLSLTLFCGDCRGNSVRKTSEAYHVQVRKMGEEVVPPCHAHLRGYKVNLKG